MISKTITQVLGFVTVFTGAISSLACTDYGAPVPPEREFNCNDFEGTDGYQRCLEQYPDDEAFCNTCKEANQSAD